MATWSAALAKAAPGEALIALTHAHIRTGLGAPLLQHIVEPSLGYVGEIATAEQWKALHGADAALRHSAMYIHYAIEASQLVEKNWGKRRSTFDVSDLVALSAAGTNFLVGMFHYFGDTPESQMAFVRFLAGLPTIHFEAEFQHPHRRRFDNSVLGTNGLLALVLPTVDRFQAAIDSTWRTPRNEPWILVTHWRHVFDAVNRNCPLYDGNAPPAVLKTIPDFVTFRTIRNSFHTLFMEGDVDMVAFQFFPHVLRFAYEHPALYAQLRAIDFYGVDQAHRESVDRLLYKAFLIFCTYTDLIDCTDPFALAR